MMGWRWRAHVDQELNYIRTLLLQLVGEIREERKVIMAAIDDLEAEVAAEEPGFKSILAIVQGIPALIAAAGTDPARLTALQTTLKARADALATAAMAVPPPAPTP